MKRIVAIVMVAAVVTLAVGAFAGSAGAASKTKSKWTKIGCLAVNKRDSIPGDGSAYTRAYVKAEKAVLTVIKKHRDAFPKSVAKKALAKSPGLDARVNAFSNWCHDQGYYG